MFKLDDLKKSIQTGFIDKDFQSEILYQPEFLINQKKPKKKVLSTMLQELNSCEAFYISVAFVTTSGIATLINTLKQLENRGVKGKVLVSQYLNFTQPEALRRLLIFSNIELKIATKENSHSKGYIFKSGSHYNLIIGSSNLTASALTTNKEWNLKVSAMQQSGIVEKVINEFNSDFNIAQEVTKEFIDTYEITYNKQRVLNSEINTKKESFSPKKIKPNSMQVDALKNIHFLRQEGKTKALLISATGTGKTYLSAFDSKAFGAKKLLFIVHRLNIAKAAMRTFQNIFSNERSMGLYSGNSREREKDFIFSTIQTISKENHLHQFSKDHFDYIIIDESHRSGAESYQRVVDYFTPRFLLGMTATPERTDGSDIFSIFDHNIAYEIRLSKAMEEDMLSQFHYYGVSDLSINGELVDKDSDFNLLTADERIEKIIANAKFYGSDNGITRGLVFCSRIEEAKELSSIFNKKGFRTIALSGENSEEQRNEAIEKLESDRISNKLDYIFTVDIFNEGVDIPKLNQIIMLRPTESSIIFIQQLGRGLRKIEEKSYLTVIDFIGNHKNNYLIPIALYGDTSYNKDSLRKLLSQGSNEIPGASTINFDQITKERIFQSIDAANMRLLTDLKKDYFLLKYKLGRIPLMIDFVEHGERDPYSFVDYAKSYYNFLCKVEDDYKDKVNLKEAKLLELFAREINNAKRIEESLILKIILETGQLSIEVLKTYIHKHYNYVVSDNTIKSAISNLNFEFIRDKKNRKLLSLRDILNLNVLCEKNEVLFFHEDFQKMIDNEYFSAFLLDSVEYSISSFNTEFKKTSWHNGFALYKKYSRKDVFRILNLKENPVAQNVGGYMVTPDKKACPFFVTYHKAEHISESTKYEDEFVNNKEFYMMSKSKRSLQSNDVRFMLWEEGEIRLPLFIKKSNDEGAEFYYMGDVSPVTEKAEQTKMKNDNNQYISVVKLLFNLYNPVSDSIYSYLTENNIKSEFEEKTPIPEEVGIPKNNKAKKNLIPFYNFYAAAGSFSDMQFEKEYTLIEYPDKYILDKDYFTCKIIGESMNKIIPNGSICIFKPYQGGSRNGKIVLVENVDMQDPDFSSAFTIKTYTSEKVISDDGWHHTQIELRPNSFDDSYTNIIIDEDNGREMRIVGEFIEVLEDIEKLK